MNHGDTHRLIYLHGFRSSPESSKAKQLRQRFEQLSIADRFCCPQLPMSPNASLALIRERYKPRSQDVLVGSSLGSLYAHYLAEEQGSRCVLINPAIYPSVKLASYVGPLKAYHSDADLHWTSGDVDELRAIESIGLSRPERYLLLAATGDEIIDWRDMKRRYEGARQLIVEGSDHGFSGFENHIDLILSFAGFPDAPQS
ncbi:MAG: esterase [Betaproteobacteria bacterium]|nr:esterase [Betaproteobacteria bacterium]